MDAKRKAIPKSIRMTVYQKCNGHCAYCGCNLEYRDMQVDHVIPLNGWSEQGTDTVDNMLPNCKKKFFLHIIKLSLDVRYNVRYYIYDIRNLVIATKFNYTNFDTIANTLYEN